MGTISPSLHNAVGTAARAKEREGNKKEVAIVSGAEQDC